MGEVELWLSLAILHFQTGYVVFLISAICGCSEKFMISYNLLIGFAILLFISRHYTRIPPPHTHTYPTYNIKETKRIIMQHYFGAWKTFSEFLVINCWLNFDIGCSICQNLLKNAKKGNCWLKTWGFFVVSCLQLWYLGEKWPKGSITTYENNYNRIYDPLENIDFSVFVIFINFKQFWPI